MAADDISGAERIDQHDWRFLMLLGAVRGCFENALVEQASLKGYRTFKPDGRRLETNDNLALFNLADSSKSHSLVEAEVIELAVPIGEVDIVKPTVLRGDSHDYFVLYRRDETGKHGMVVQDFDTAEAAMGPGTSIEDFIGKILVYTVVPIQKLTT